MNTETTNTNDSTNEEDKAKTVLSNMSARRVFDTVEEATTYLTKCSEELADFGDYPVVTAGFTDEGEFDPEIYNESMQVAVARMTARGEGVGQSVVKSIVIYPSPKLAAIYEDDKGRDWLEGIIQKELQHVAVRGLRPKDGEDANLEEALSKMPLSIADYVTSGREGATGIVTAYNDTWKLIKQTMGKKSKAFAIANLSKKELKKSMESASYAAAIYPQLETRTNKAGEPESYFEKAAQFGAILAKQQGLDPTIFENMLAHRAETEINFDLDDEDEDFDLEALAAELVEDEEETDAE